MIGILAYHPTQTLSIFMVFGSGARCCSNQACQTMSDRKKNCEQKTWKKDIVCVAPRCIFFFCWFTGGKIFTLRRLMGKHIYLYNIKGSTSLLPVLGNKQILPEATKVQTACQKPPNHTSTKLQSQHWTLQHPTRPPYHAACTVTGLCAWWLSWNSSAARCSGLTELLQGPKTTTNHCR